MVAEVRTHAVPRAQLDARYALAFCGCFVVLAALTPLGAWRWLGVQFLALAFAAGYLGVAPGLLMRRWLGLAVVVAFLAAMVGLTHPARSSLGLAGVMAALAARNAVMLGAVVLLASAYPPERLIGALGRLGVPGILVSTLQFMLRYVSVLGGERDRMLLARRSRSFRAFGFWAWGDLGRLIGALFVRAMERGERVHAAMLARGWDGTPRSLEGHQREPEPAS